MWSYTDVKLTSLTDTWCIPSTLYCTWSPMTLHFCSIISIPTAWCHSLLLVLFLTGLSVRRPISQMKILLLFLLHLHLHLHLHLPAHASFSASHMHCRSTHRKPRYLISLSFFFRCIHCFLFCVFMCSCGLMHIKQHDLSVCKHPALFSAQDMVWQQTALLCDQFSNVHIFSKNKWT